jgi:hypothetical protein
VGLPSGTECSRPVELENSLDLNCHLYLVPWKHIRKDSGHPLFLVNNLLGNRRCHLRASVHQLAVGPVEELARAVEGSSPSLLPSSHPLSFAPHCPAFNSPFCLLHWSGARWRGEGGRNQCLIRFYKKHFISLYNFHPM